MKPLYSATFLSFALLVTSHSQTTRKSLRFGPRHPTAHYVTKPQITSSFSAHADPFDVARAFVRSLTDSDHYIRNDSYTDYSTGITHVYVRQLYDGLEVADGDMNLNVRDGQVLSFGNSFYQGSSGPLVDYPPISHATYCADFATRSLALKSSPNGGGSQMPLLAQSTARDEWYMRHCVDPLTAIQRVATPNSYQASLDPRWAALYFMIAAHPESSAVDTLVRDFDTTIESMTITYDNDSAAQLIRSASISGLPGSVGPVEAQTVYIQIPHGNETVLYPTWRLEVEMAHNWYNAFVSIHDPSVIVSVIDWASDSPISSHSDYPGSEANSAPRQSARYAEAGKYKVWKFGINDPESGKQTVEPASYDSLASPVGWHTIPRPSNPAGSPEWIGKSSKKQYPYNLNFTTTWGNNVFAQENWSGTKDRHAWISKSRPEGGEDLTFKFGYRSKDLNNYASYVDLSVTQLFYTANMIHDLYYRYGFDEGAGNFQQHNFGPDGLGNDAVIASAQNGGSFNNAYFIAPPDGKHGRCNMYIWDTATPYRDGSLDAGIVIHELSHGLSSRLTGGPLNANCLPWGESAGMGEGWGDFFATLIRSTEEYHDYPIGNWTSNKPGGVRRYLYSKFITVNPSLYSTLDDDDTWGLHGMGEIWAEILWVVAQKMIEKHGYSPSLFPPQPLDNGTIPTGDFYNARADGGPLVPKHGNTLMLQLVIEGMKLQGCRPSFLVARDAIIDADERLTGGDNYCVLWEAFSSRGLGEGAVFYPDGTPWGDGEHVDGFTVPERCR